MKRKIIVPLAGALALATALDVGISTVSAAPMGIAPKAAVATQAQVTEVQYRYRRGYRGYRRGYGGWGAPAVGAAVGLGVLGAAAAAATAGSYYGGGYGYGYPAYGGYGGGYGCYPGYNC